MAAQEAALVQVRQLTSPWLGTAQGPHAGSDGLSDLTVDHNGEAAHGSTVREEAKLTRAPGGAWGMHGYKSEPLILAAVERAVPAGGTDSTPAWSHVLEAVSPEASVRGLCPHAVAPPWLCSSPL